MEDQVFNEQMERIKFITGKTYRKVGSLFWLVSKEYLTVYCLLVILK